MLLNRKAPLDITSHFVLAYLRNKYPDKTFNEPMEWNFEINSNSVSGSIVSAFSPISTENTVYVGLLDILTLTASDNYAFYFELEQIDGNTLPICESHYDAPSGAGNTGIRTTFAKHLDFVELFSVTSVLESENVQNITNISLYFTGFKVNFN